MEKINNKQLSFTYDKEGDVLDVAIGSAKKAISREIAEDFFIRFDPKTKEVLGFMILNFQHQFRTDHETATIPITGHFELSKAVLFN